jgi:hypothetical protein
MFERYTEKARRAVFFARYECSQFGSPTIESEHLLLGILREYKSWFQFFRKPLVDGEASIRRQIEQHIPPSQKISTSVDLPLSDECTRILAYAAEEADQFSHKFIGTEHLFLGILRESTCYAATLLNERGVSLDHARSQIGSKPPEQVGSPPRSLGIPSGYTSHKLLFNSAAQMLVIELRRNGAMHLLPTRLFFRHKDTEVYEQIGTPSEEISYESPVTCSSLPIVIFNSLKWDKSRRGGNWDGIYRFHLDTRELEVCVSRKDLKLAQPHGRMWVVELISLSEDASTLVVNIGVEKEVSGGGVVNYFLAAIRLNDQQIELLSPLRDIRF